VDLFARDESTVVERRRVNVEIVYRSANLIVSGSREIVPGWHELECEWVVRL